MSRIRNIDLELEAEFYELDLTPDVIQGKPYEVYFAYGPEKLRKAYIDGVKKSQARIEQLERELKQERNKVNETNRRWFERVGCYGCIVDSEIYVGDSSKVCERCVDGSMYINAQEKKAVEAELKKKRRLKYEE